MDTQYVDTQHKFNNASVLGSKLNEFTEEQRISIYSNLIAIELTEGCSLRCNFCGMKAPRYEGVRTPFDTLDELASDIGNLTTIDKTEKSRLYLGTDPLDYEDGERNYFDVLKLFTDRGLNIDTCTSIPKGKEELAVNNIDKIDRISISHHNRKRLEPWFKELGIALYLELPRIISGDYADPRNKKDIIKIEKPINEVLKELRKEHPSIDENVIPTFYTSRDPKNIPEIPPDKKIECLFYCDENPDKHNKIKDRGYNGISNIGEAYDLKNDQNSTYIFEESKGVKITPRGIFYITRDGISKTNPTGLIITEVTPENIDYLLNLI